MAQGIPGQVFSTAKFGGEPYSEVLGPLVVGRIADNASAASGPFYPASGVMVVQTTASKTNQVVTTSATGATRNSFIYIPVTTGILQGAGAPPFTGVGTPLVWNDNSRRLEIWSSGAAEWIVMTSSGTFSSS